MKADETLDLKGVPCPQNSAKALIQLETMSSGEVLEIIIDDGEPFDNVPASIEDEDDDYKIEKLERDEQGLWHLFVRVL